MIGKDIINLLTEAGYIKPGVDFITLTASVEGRVSINADYLPETPAENNDDELTRLRLIEKLAAKMVKLQLEDGQVDDRLAEQIRMLITQDG